MAVEPNYTLSYEYNQTVNSTTLPPITDASEELERCTKGAAIDILNVTINNNNNNNNNVILNFMINDPELSDIIYIRISWGDTIIDSFIISHSQNTLQYTHEYPGSALYLITIQTTNAAGFCFLFFFVWFGLVWFGLVWFFCFGLFFFGMNKTVWNFPKNIFKKNCVM